MEVTLRPGYYYKIGPRKNKRFDSILGPFSCGGANFVLTFNRKKKGELNEIATSFPGLKEKIYGEAVISSFEPLDFKDLLAETRLFVKHCLRPSV